MRLLIVDTYYDQYWRLVYQDRSELMSLPYTDQWRTMMDQCFGVADFYSSNFAKLGHEAHEVIVNCEPMQRSWALEHGLRNVDHCAWTIRLRRGILPWPQQSINWLYTILAAQVKEFRPDVFFIHDMNGISAEFLRTMRPYVRVIVGQIACPIASKADFREYDLVLSSFPHFVEYFRKQGLRSAYFKLGFEPRILEKLGVQEKRYQTVFVGGFSKEHSERVVFLEAVAKKSPIDIWGYGKECLNVGSPLRMRHHGNAWAMDMYRVLRNAAIALNYHINTSEYYANNMRLYEATGVGTLLLTDYKSNLDKLFTPGEEITAYRSPDECVDLIHYYLQREEERQAIAYAGQRRTLREHTYYHRMKELVEILKSLLRHTGRRRDLGIGWPAESHKEQ